MNKTFIAVAALLAMSILPAGALRAQVPAPSATPEPDPHVYEDLGMRVRVPSPAVLVGYRRLPLKALGDDPATIAAWVIDPGKEDMQTVQLQMEAYNAGPLEGFESTFEDETRPQLEGALVKDKTQVTLKNGMPAYWLSITFGSGFDSKKTYAYIWVDGSRGVILSITGRIGEIDAAKAHAMLDDVEAVRYPAEREAP
jgi:hypothetical protein